MLRDRKGNIMKIKRFLSMIIVFSVLFGTFSVRAAAPTSSLANEPWVLGHVDMYEDAYVGAYASITHHPRTGKAYISYYDENSTGLKMAHEVTPGTGNCGTGNAWQCEVVQSSDSVGRFSSIDVTFVSKSPVILSYTLIGISYYDASKQRLRYAECKLLLTESDCSWAAYNVDDSSLEFYSYGMYSSLAFDDYAVPHIAYNYALDVTIHQSGVKYATYVSEGGGNCIEGGSWDCVNVDHGSYTLEYGAYTSLDFHLLGYPVIAYYNSELGALEVATGNNEGSDCDNEEWNCRIIDDTGDVGRFTSLAPKQEDSGFMFAYYDSDHRTVKYAVFVWFDGNCGQGAYNCFDVDQTSEVYPEYYSPISLAVDGQGFPIIAYMNSASETSPDYLKVARPAEAYGHETGNCGEPRPGDMFQYWECRTIDPPHSNIGVGAYVSISVNLNGLADIAYSDQNLLWGEQYLKIARQRFAVYLPLIVK